MTPIVSSHFFCLLFWNVLVKQDHLIDSHLGVSVLRRNLLSLAIGCWRGIQLVAATNHHVSATFTMWLNLDGIWCVAFQLAVDVNRQTNVFVPWANNKEPVIEDHVCFDLANWNILEFSQNGYFSKIKAIWEANRELVWIIFNKIVL